MNISINEVKILPEEKKKTRDKEEGERRGT